MQISSLYTHKDVYTPLLPARARKNAVQQARGRRNEGDVCPVSRRQVKKDSHNGRREGADLHVHARMRIVASER